VLLRAGFGLLRRRIFMPHPFEVQESDITRLALGEAVRLVRDLLWAEARRQRLGPGRVTITEQQNVADGGIDATVEGPSETPGALCSGFNGFQIKSGTSFKPWQQAMVRDELFGSSEPEREHLGKAVRRCLDTNGRYVLVCSGHAFQPEQRAAARDHFVGFLRGCGYPDPRIEILGAVQLLEMFHPYPSLRLALLGRDLPFRTLEEWARDRDMLGAFTPGPRHEQFVDQLRAELEQPAASHLRVLGAPGIGKTRLVLEALRTPGLQPLVVYVGVLDMPTMRSLLLDQIGRSDNAWECVLVVDECDQALRAELANRLMPFRDRVRVITITSDQDEARGLVLLEAPPLADGELAAVFSSHGVAENESRRWIPFCGGSPRVAHVLATNLCSAPDDVLAPPAESDVWRRFAAGSERTESERVQRRLTALRHLARFERFGFGAAFQEEWTAVVELLDGALTRPQLEEAVRELRDRRILRGDATLRVEPEAFRIWLWREWWRTHGASFNYPQFATRCRGALLGWFHATLCYSEGCPEAEAFVRRALGPGGWVTEDWLGGPGGGELLSALSQADPEGMVGFLERTVGRWSFQRRVEFRAGRQAVVWALERIAVSARLFERAARLLLLLAEAENATHGNNSTGIFCQLFSPGWGSVASTEATPEERFPILRDALASTSPPVRRIARAACRAALEANHFSRMIGAEHRGIVATPRLWQPQTWGELHDHYRRVWAELRAAYHLSAGVDRAECAAILTEKGGQLATGALADEVLATFVELEQDEEARQRLVATVGMLLRYSDANLSEASRVGLRSLATRLDGTDLRSRLRRHVGMNLHTDYVVENEAPGAQVARTLEGLASAIAADDRELDHNLPWLSTKAAERAGAFGRHLGFVTPVAELVQRALVTYLSGAATDRSPAFLAGLSCAFGERDRDALEDELDRLALRADTAALVPTLMRASRLSTRGAERLLSLVGDGRIAATELLPHCWSSNVAPDLPASPLERLLASVTAIDNDDASLAATLLFSERFTHTEAPVPRELSLRVVMHSRAGRSCLREWTEVVRRHVKDYPADSALILEWCLDRISEDLNVSDAIMNLAGELLGAEPEAGWRIVGRRLADKTNRDSYAILRWLSGGSAFDSRSPLGPLLHVPEQTLWAWIEEDREDRARLLANALPKVMSRDASGAPLTRGFLSRYGASTHVQGALLDRYSSEGWQGSASEHYAAQARRIETWLALEEDAPVRAWLTRYGESLNAHTEREVLQEERE
jgi:hypothetical protein